MKQDFESEKKNLENKILYKDPMHNINMVLIIAAKPVDETSSSWQERNIIQNINSMFPSTYIHKRYLVHITEKKRCLPWKAQVGTALGHCITFIYVQDMHLPLHKQEKLAPQRSVIASLVTNKSNLQSLISKQETEKCEMGLTPTVVLVFSCPVTLVGLHGHKITSVVITVLEFHWRKMTQGAQF